MRRVLVGAIVVSMAWSCSTGPRVPAAIVLSPDPVQVKQGAVATVTARVVDEDGGEITGLTVALTVADPTLAQVNGDTVTGVAPGLTTLTGTYEALSTSVDVEVYGHPSRATVTPVNLSGGPFATVVSRDGRMFVARHFADTVSSAQLPGNAFNTHLLVGDDPTSLAVDSAGERLYITKQFSDNVGVVDIATNAMTDSIPVSGNPFIVAVSPDQTALFVTTSGGVVERIPLSSGQAVPFDSYTAASNGIAFNPAGSRMYVSTINGTVYEYALPSGNGMRTFSAAGIFQGLAVSEGGTTLHVADENFGLRAWDLTTGGALPPLALSGGPFDLKLTPDGTQLWVSLASGQAVVVLDQATRTVIDTIATGGTPRRIAFDRYGAVALIGNESGWADVVR